MEILSSCTHPQVVPNLWISVEHKRRYFKECWEPNCFWSPLTCIVLFFFLSTVWLPTFFKTSSFVFITTDDICGWTIPINEAQICTFETFSPKTPIIINDTVYTAQWVCLHHVFTVFVLMKACVRSQIIESTVCSVDMTVLQLCNLWCDRSRSKYNATV